jgi:hypothetical protein
LTCRSWARCLAATILVLGAVACATLGGGLAAAEAPADPCGTVPSAGEQRLYRLLMEYRRAKGLPPIPLSPSLSFVARAHVRDLQGHPPTGKCNGHSWSADGAWTPCCYTDDHARAQCMWDKPRELTRYPGNGYEISAWNSGQQDADSALSCWKGSPLHNAVIVNSGVWARIRWKAVGVGIYGSYAVVWFGEEADPCSE